MPATKKIENFENKDDIFALIDKFEKSSLCELEITIAYPIERETRIKMTKTSGASRLESHIDNDIPDELNDEPEEALKTVKMVKSDSAVSANVIKSPIIGTFYASPSPESEAYVKVGDKVSKGMILCIIEAMKIMNEIECETDGVIDGILVKTGDAVEYGQPLFRIRN